MRLNNTRTVHGVEDVRDLLGICVTCVLYLAEGLKVRLQEEIAFLRCQWCNKLARGLRLCKCLTFNMKTSLK